MVTAPGTGLPDNSFNVADKAVEPSVWDDFYAITHKRSREGQDVAEEDDSDECLEDDYGDDDWEPPKWNMLSKK